MTEDAARREVAEYWMGRADAALMSAASELAARRFDFAANRAYYAAFYAASAVLLVAGRKCWADVPEGEAGMHTERAATGLCGDNIALQRRAEGYNLAMPGNWIRWECARCKP